MTRFTELVGCRLPLQQAGMGGVSTPALAMAVAAEGGLGMLAMQGWPADAVAAALADLAPPPGGALGINFLMPFLNRDAVPVAAGRVRVVEFFYGEPDPSLVEIVHVEGALAAWQVG